MASAGASSRSSDSIHLWDVVEGRPSRKLEGHVCGDTSLAWSPDEQLLAAGAGTTDPSVRIWSVAGGEVAFTLKNSSDVAVVRSVAFSPDGQTLAAGDTAGVVQFWEPLSGRKLQALPAPVAGIGCAAFAPDEITLAAGYGDGSVRLFLTESGEAAGRTAPAGNAVKRMAYSPDARTLATSYAENGLVDLWQTGTGARLSQLRGTRKGIECLVWSADSKTIAVGNGTGNGTLWDAASGTPVRNLPNHGSAMAWSPDGATLAIAVGGDVRLFAGGFGKPTENMSSSGDAILALLWSPDGKTLASAKKDNLIYLWDMEAVRPKARTCEGHKTTPVSLAWLEDGAKLVSGSAIEVCVWETASGKLERTFETAGTAISPGGRLFAGREGSTLRLRSLEDGSLVRSIVSLPGGGYLALSPQGHYLTTPEAEAELVCVVRTESGQQMLTPEQFAEAHGWKNDPALVQSWSD